MRTINHPYMVFISVRTAHPTANLSYDLLSQFASKNYALLVQDFSDIILSS